MCMISNIGEIAKISMKLVFSLGIIEIELCVSCKRLHKSQYDIRRI